MQIQNIVSVHQFNNYHNRNKKCKNNYSVSFEAGSFQMLAVSDVHGGLRSLAQFTETIFRNCKKIFENPSAKSTLNLLTISGDWFINQNQKGYLSDSNLSNGDIQKLFIKRFINKLKSMIGDNVKFKTVFTPGNHDFDGGDEFLLGLLDSIPVDMVVTNLRNHKQLGHTNLVKSAVYEVSDSVSPEMKHKVLFLGTTLQNMNYYNSGLINKMEFFENISATDAQLPESIFDETIDEINKEIKKFKKDNPEGAVILLSHVGNKFSDLIANKTNGINMILNGHDHVETMNIVNDVPIVSLGQNCEMFRGIKFNFNDNGILDKITIDTFYTKDTPSIEVQMHEFNVELDRLLQDDMRPLIKILPNQYGLNELVYNKSIRYSNSPYANFLTTSLRNALKLASYDIDTLGIQSSAIRGGIKHGSSNLDLLKAFDGIKVNLSEINIAELKGSELADVIIENVLENLTAPERNTIMLWSDIQVNRSLFKSIQEGKSSKKYSDAIKIRNKKTGEYEPIDFNKTYKTAMTKKFISKNDLEAPKKIRDKFTPTGILVQDAFHNYLQYINYEIDINNEIMESRIL